jgi:hypothetical protein
MSSLVNPDSGYLGAKPTQPTYEVMVIDGVAHRIHAVVVYRFSMGDVEDPDLYAGEPLWKWQQSEMGQFVMSKAVEPPEWHRMADLVSYGYQYAVRAKLKARDYTFWTLKWGSHQ